MASTYSPGLGIELPGTGDQAGVWGNTTNTNLGTLIEQAISGYVTQAVATGTDTTITIPNGATGVARNMYIELTGTGGASTNLIVPANKKLYFIFNNTSSGQVTVKVSGQTGISVPNGKKMILVSNGTDIVTAENYVASLSSDNLTLTGTLAVGSTSTFTGAATFTANPTLSGGTANGVLYLNGSKVATSGSVLTFDGTNVNIGGSGSGSRFVVRGTGTTSATFSIEATTSGGATRFLVADDGLCRWYGTSNAETMRLDNAGNLGIGTASPASKLEVTGDITQTWAASMDRFVGSKFSTTYELGLHFIESTRETRIVSKAADSTGLISFYTGVTPTQRAVIDSSGNLGIGTASPGAKLDVVDTAASTVNVRATNSSASAGAYVQFRANSDAGSAYFGVSGSGNAVNGGAFDGDFSYLFADSSSSGLNIGTGAAVPIRFYTNGSSSSAMRMLLDTSGNLGIGTASPGYRLDVSGTGRVTTEIRVKNSAGNVSYLTFEENGNGNSATFISGDARTSGYMGFWTNSTERLRLDSSGNLGLGVTPSAWGGGLNGTGLQVGAYTSITSANAFGAGYGFNFYYDGTNYRYVASNYASLIEQSGGAFRFKTVASGTAGNTITFTQAMTLDASGNLLVGTSTSTFGRLEVVGGAGIRVNEDGAGTKVISIRSDFAGVDPAVFVNTNNALLFGTNNTERGRFTAGGYFKASNNGSYAGSTANYHEFNNNAGDWVAVARNFASSSAYGIYVHYSASTPNGTGNEFLYCADNTTARATIRSNGGVANYQANDVNLSDERTKKDIAPLGSMWAKIKALEIVTFKYKDQTHDDDNIGLIAQQVESVAPEFVDADGWGETPEDGVPLKSIYTADMYHAAIKALQEAMARIESLEADMAALKGAK